MYYLIGSLGGCRASLIHTPLPLPLPIPTFVPFVFFCEMDSPMSRPLCLHRRQVKHRKQQLDRKLNDYALKIRYEFIENTEQYNKQILTVLPLSHWIKSFELIKYWNVLQIIMSLLGAQKGQLVVYCVSCRIDVYCKMSICPWFWFEFLEVIW